MCADARASLTEVFFFARPTVEAQIEKLASCNMVLAYRTVSFSLAGVCLEKANPLSTVLRLSVSGAIRYSFLSFSPVLLFLARLSPVQAFCNRFVSGTLKS
jgi:hypothetical protein